jgi:hypothetical protein
LNRENSAQYNARVERCKSKHPKAQAARVKVMIALQQGKMSRGNCELCGDTRTHGHHDDYDLPLVVRWLCAKHHRAWHIDNGPGANID